MIRTVRMLNPAPNCSARSSANSEDHGVMEFQLYFTR